MVTLLVARGIVITAQGLGTMVHRQIFADITAKIPDAETEVFIPGAGIVGPGGYLDVYIPPNAAYEIKPLGGWVNPEKQLARYIRAANDFKEMFPTGLVKGEYPFDETIEKGPFDLMRVHYYLLKPGVIDYELIPTDFLKVLAGLSIMTLMILMLPGAGLICEPALVNALAFAGI